MRVIRPAWPAARSASAARPPAWPAPPMTTCLSLTSIGLVWRKGLVGHDGEGVLHVRQGLKLLDDEMADVHLVGKIAFHQEIVLARDGIDLGDLLDALDGFLGDLVGLAEVAFHHDEDRLHAGSLP